jgi:hypothetical protein
MSVKREWNDAFFVAASEAIAAVESLIMEFAR